jgi:hypothetical protein
MTRRSLVAAAVGAAALLAVVGTAHQAESAARKPKIRNATASPTRIPGVGGGLNLTVNVNPNRTTVTGVTAVLSGGGAGSGKTVTLTHQGNNSYRGTTSIGGNPQNRRQTVRIRFTVTANTGGRAAATKSVTQDPGGTSGGGDLPPPPPPI